MNGLQENFHAQFNEKDGLVANFGDVQVIHTDDYNDLFNKPSINEVVLVGNKSLEDLGDNPLTNVEIQEIFNRVFNG